MSDKAFGDTPGSFHRSPYQADFRRTIERRARPSAHLARVAVSPFGKIVSKRNGGAIF